MAAGNVKVNRNVRLVSSQKLFSKKLSTTDVKKCLLVPVMHAKLHFPDLSAVPTGELFLDFATAIDAPIQRLRYTRWNSGGGRHVIAAGWTKFAKQQGFQPGDDVEFHRCCIQEEDGRITTVMLVTKAKSEWPQRKLKLFGWDLYF